MVKVKLKLIEPAHLVLSVPVLIFFSLQPFFLDLSNITWHLPASSLFSSSLSLAVFLLKWN